jgi:hypothetical protein
MDEFHPMIYLFNSTQMKFIHMNYSYMDTFIHVGGLKSHTNSKLQVQTLNSCTSHLPWGHDEG